jgi:hypothetical protein
VRGVDAEVAKLSYRCERIIGMTEREPHKGWFEPYWRFPSTDGPGTERILITVPGVENLHTIADLLRRAGAQLTEASRTFSVEGDLTVTQAAALMELAVFRDGNSEGNQVSIRFDAIDREPGPSPDEWWSEQQVIQRRPGV